MTTKMRSFLAISVAACAAVHSRAFSCPSTSTSFVAQYRSRNTILLAHRNGRSEPAPSLKFAGESAPQTSQSARQRIQKAGLAAWERMDTLKAAGLCDNGSVPMQAGFKRNVGLFVAAFLFKWYRARFVTKIPVWDRQPQWNMVVTSPEQEKELHAYECTKCGSTIFIARHREWFFKGGNTECTNCDAKGLEYFRDIRADVLDSIDDDYFDYESPLDFVSAAERRKLVKQAGGDEELAKKIAIDNAIKNDKDQIRVDESSPSSSGGEIGDVESKKRMTSAPATKKTSADDDIFAELDMDL